MIELALFLKLTPKIRQHFSKPFLLAFHDISQVFPLKFQKEKSDSEPNLAKREDGGT
jgi:hypothetical protein